MFDYQQWLKEQQTQGIPGMPQAKPDVQRPDSGFVVARDGEQQGMDPAMRAMLGIEGLSPKQKQMERKRAQIQQLRDMALGGGARHWTGVLAQGLAGGISGYQDRKLDPQEEALNEERRRMMEQIGLGL